MAKTLLETYKALYEANKFRAQAAGLGAAPAAPSSTPVDAKAQGIGARPAASPSTSGTSTAFGGRPAPSDAINKLGRVSQKPEARPLTMGGSVPGRQVNSTMIAARSSNMQGRPAGSPTQAVTVNRQVTSTGNPNTAGGTAPVRPAAPAPAPSTGVPQNRMDVVRQAQQKAKQDARVQAVSRPAAPAPVSRTPGRGDSTGGRYGMQRPEISKPDNQPYNMNIPKKSPTLKAQTDGKIGGRYDIAPDKKPLAKPADQPYNMKIPEKSPTLKAQMDGNITSKQPADQDIARRNARIQAVRRPVNTDSNVPLSNTSSAAAAEPNGEKPNVPLPKVKPANPTKTKKVVQKPNVRPAVPVAGKPKADRTKPNISSFAKREAKRRVLSGKEGVGPEANRLRKTSGVRLGKTTGTTIRQKNLGEMVTNLIRRKLEERHTFAGAARSANHDRLGELGTRRGDEKQKMDLSRYQRVVSKRLAEEDVQAETKQPKTIKHKKGTLKGKPVVFDPETTNLAY